MRIRNLLCAIFVITALVVAPATAQSGGSSPTYGVGVSGFGGVDVYVPIHLTSLRLEPQLGFSRSSTSGQNTSQSNSQLTLGSGVFTTLSSYESTDIYAGGRIGIVRNAQSQANVTTSTTDFFLGPAIGGEYYFGDHFSLGVEGALYYRSIGTGSSNTSQSRINTDARTFVRIYL